jgi:hypothetical protein
MAHDAPGMKGYRPRTKVGPLKEKRGDTHMETIERKYHRDFDVRSDMHLHTLLREKGYASLNNLLHGEK